MEIYPQKDDHLVLISIIFWFISRIPERKKKNYIYMWAAESIVTRLADSKVILFALRLLFTQDCDDLSPERDLLFLMSIVF